MTTPSALTRFRTEYGAHRASEGRAHSNAELLALPYLRTGPLAKQWSVRARTFEAFMRRVVAPVARGIDDRPLRVLDLGAGNGWLCHRLARVGSDAVAVDIRDDCIDGLGAAGPLLSAEFPPFERVVGSFDALPVREAHFDVVVFNASLHYAIDLHSVLDEARRVTRTGGCVAILDSPFYNSETDGTAMVDDKRRNAATHFGERTDALMALPFIEFLTRDRLDRASQGLGLVWRRHRVSYPLWYEARPYVARLRGQRRPSRFDLWESSVA
jgi:SAM-dependent methyltransferase